MTNKVTVKIRTAVLHWHGRLLGRTSAIFVVANNRKSCPSGSLGAGMTRGQGFSGRKNYASQCDKGAGWCIYLCSGQDIKKR